MITIFILATIALTYSYIRLDNASKEQGERFSPFNGTHLDAQLFIWSQALILVGVFYILITFMP